MVVSQVAKGVVMRESGLLNWDARGVLSALSFTDGVGCFGLEHPEKATGMMDGRKGDRYREET